MMEQKESCDRFIRPADSPLPANLAALWSSDPALAELIDAIDDKDVYPVQPSKSGPPTVEIQTSEAGKILLHSRHQPIAEGQRLVQDIGTDEKQTYHILGLGLGYHLDALFRKASDEAIICVFEPDLRMIRTAMEHVDLSHILQKPRVMWLYRGEKGEFFQRLTPHTAMVSLGTHTVEHSPSMQLHPKFFEQTKTWIGEYASWTRTTMNTAVLNSRTTALNIARNVGWYAASAGLGRLQNRYKNHPAVIVSAGPSLRKNRHLLKGLERNAVLIAVQTTLQPLLDMGVEPHFVTSLDYHEICTRFFEKLPPVLGTELIAEPKCTPRVLDMMPGAVTVLGNEFAESLLRGMNLNRPCIMGGATVAHLAFYLAEYLGCDPIIFIGQDLGFSDGLYYAPGTNYEDVWRPELSRYCTMEMKQWEQIVRERPILRKIPDYLGRPMYTEERLFTYLQQFERDFARSSARIIDASEGGARKNGAEVMTFQQAIDQFCRDGLPSPAEPAPLPNWNRLEECRRCIRTRGQEAKQIEQLSRQTLPLLTEVRDNLQDQGHVNRLIVRIDQLRAQMDKHSRTYDQVTQFTQQSELRRFQHDRRLAADRVTGMDKQKRQVERDIDNVTAMITAAQDFQDLMDEVEVMLADRQMRRKLAA